MKTKEFKDNLRDFIIKSTCSFTCVKEIERYLKSNNYKKLKESDKWKLTGSKFYIIRNDASIIAFEIPKNHNGSFSVVTSHCDTPSLLLKPNGAYSKNNYLKHNIMPYGGLLNYGWLDHPLSLAGRFIVKNNNKLSSKIVDLKKTMLIVPSLAIHQNDKANSNLDLNMQIDLQPIVSLTNKKETWNNILNKVIEKRIIDYDLFAYNNQKPEYIGYNNELLISPRIDNLTSVYSSLISFIESKSNNIKVFCSFNNEEIGSLTVEGADSNFLIETLKKIASYFDIDITESLANSFIISSDNSHAIHPNHSEFADDTGVLYLGKGLAIIKEINSTTNAISSSIIKTICDKNKIKYQDATSKNDLATGSTLSGISLRHVSVLSVDVGIPQLAMHSSIEVCSVKDIISLYKMMKCFYETIIKKKNDIYEIK